jgi:hypothetical protein
MGVQQKPSRLHLSERAHPALFSHIQRFQWKSCRPVLAPVPHAEEKRVFFFLTHFLVLTTLPIRYNAFIGAVSPYGKSHGIELRRFRE